MEDEGTRITIVGVIAIIAAIIMAGVLLSALRVKGSLEPEQDKTP